MACLRKFTFTGDPDTLLRIKQERVDPVAFDIARRHGALAQFYARTGDGLVLYTLWETSAGPEAFKEIAPIGRAAGMPVPVHEVTELVARHLWWGEPAVDSATAD